MSTLDLTRGMPSGLTMPEEFVALADWCSRTGFVVDGHGLLATPDSREYREVEIGGQTPPSDDPGEVRERLWPVIRTGRAGSHVCLWLDDDGHQQVVHRAAVSGSGSSLNAILPGALPVLRLLAVGYAQPAYNQDWDSPPDAEEDGDGSALGAYREWLGETTGSGTPRTGVEALDLPASDVASWTHVEGPDDAFSDWITAVTHTL